MDLQTIIGFGIAVSLPVWLLIEEVSRRLHRRILTRSEPKARIRSERRRERALKRQTAALSGQARARPGMAAAGMNG